MSGRPRHGQPPDAAPAAPTDQPPLAPPAAAAAAAAADEPPRKSDVTSVFAVVGAVTSQAALISGLLFYFGWTYSHAYYGYFGVDVGMLGLSTSDYLLRSINVTFWPAILTVLPILVLLAAHHLLIRPAIDTARCQRQSAPAGIDPENDAETTRPPRPAKAWLAPALTTVFGLGVGLLGVVVVGILRRGDVGVRLGIYLPIALVVAVVLIGYVIALRARYQAPLAVPLAKSRSTTPTRPITPALSMLVLLALGFLGALWAVGLYGDREGQQRAESTAHNLTDSPSVVLDSVAKLAIPEGTATHVAPISAPDEKYHYQYSGLILLARAPGYYFLIPQNWEQRHDRVYIVRDTDNIRIDLALNP
ncbi:hypothetical protein KO481_17140 [Nocardia sp. NEAU-G5]|uniref:Uncharacterized protein n=1 Tax=Nocardia albiluteola TaxID=2842303 RepID=A0ABS6AZE3_9NOCA|nr:hypothetical protein [Nocardia albiluteola]MBU3063248.1 hypothetical protein [Nocardia albiluteola]